MNLKERNDEIIKMYQDTDLTLEAIGRLYRISRQRVFQIIQRNSDTKKRQRRKEVRYNRNEVIYEGLRYWMNKNNVNKADLFKQLKSCPTTSTMSSILRGTRPITKSIIDDILKITGLTYDFCFKVIEPSGEKAVWNISSDGYFPYCSNCLYEPYKEVAKFNASLEDITLCPNCGAQITVKK